jgi:hypothetical protein
MLLTGLVVALAGPSGCEGTRLGAGKALQARLDAALAVSDVYARDLALAQLSQDAALAGEADVVKKALGKISDINRKEVATEVAALKLAWVDRTAEAIEVAKTIRDSKRRDALLAKLDKG